jgi:hypothetical protein
MSRSNSGFLLPTSSRRFCTRLPWKRKEKFGRGQLKRQGPEEGFGSPLVTRKVPTIGGFTSLMLCEEHYLIAHVISQCRIFLKEKA